MSAPLLSTPQKAIFDTGSTSNFGTLNGPYLNNRPLLKPHVIICPNGTVIYATEEADLNLPSISKKARRVKLSPTQSSDILISIGQLCDASCITAFTASNVYIWYDGRVVLERTRAGPNELWIMELLSVGSQSIIKDLFTSSTFRHGMTVTKTIVNWSRVRFQQ